MLENKMVVDSYWGEIEYGVPIPKKERPQEIRQDDEEEEMEESINEY